MDLLKQYSIYFGTTRGVLGHTVSKPAETTSFELEECEKSEVTSLNWGRTDTEIVVGHKNGVLKLYSSLNNKYTKTIDDLVGKGAIVGTGIKEKSVIIARHGGDINIWSKMDVNSFSLNLEGESTLETMVQHQQKLNVIGTGGERNDFQLWDLELEKQIFKAKSLGHDELNLPIPTSIRGICFFSNESNVASCVTKEGYVLLYDDRAQRKPVTKFIEPRASYSSIACTYREKQCVVGTTKGYIQLIDLRTPSKCINTYKSFTGGVTSLICDPITPIVASTSLDRHVRIHNLDTKQCLYKKYMKQNLTRLIIKPIIKEEVEDDVKIVNEPIDEEYEELFENMKTVGDETRSKRKGVKESSSHKKRKTVK